MDKSLTKREKRELAREKKRNASQSRSKSEKTKKISITLIITSILLISGFWLYTEITKPLPGQLFEDLGREHVTDISEVTYNSNPPTSGTHFPIWAKRGVYDRVISDGYLIHSLEHGYIVISYDCTKPLSDNSLFTVKNVSAHFTDIEHEELDSASLSAKPLTRMKVGNDGAMSAFTPENAPNEEALLLEAFYSEECKGLIGKLSKFLDDWQRVVIVPRSNMDTPIALTAWTRLEKLNSFDERKIKDFISSYHNRGPEQTAE